MQPKPFAIGRLCATPGALSLLTPERITAILIRFLSFDWGECEKQDWVANNLATLDGGRIFAVYWIDEQDHDKGKCWLICEAEPRKYSTFLLPEEY